MWFKKMDLAASSIQKVIPVGPKKPRLRTWNGRDLTC